MMSLIKFKRKSLTILFSVFAIVGFSIVVVRPKVYEQMSKARDSEIITTLNTLAKSEEAFYVEYKAFTDNPSALGFPELPGVHIFFSGKLVPEKYSAKLKIENAPFVDKDSYRILLVVDRKERSVEFWTIDNERKITKHKEIDESSE